MARNREPILAVLKRVLPERGTVLELASGSGEHAAFFAPELPRLTWLATDVDPASLESIRAWRRQANVGNLAEPVVLDVLDEPWPLERAEVVVAMNLIHIAPWEVCEALMRGAARILPNGGTLFLYGPYLGEDAPGKDSNSKFDEDLRRRNAAWGVRDLGEVTRLAQEHGLELRERVPMPANNLSLVFWKRGVRDEREDPCS